MIDEAPTHYPEPTDHCYVCRWAAACETRRRDVDHLCLVANISKSQITELQTHGVSTSTALSQLPFPMPWKPDRGSPASFQKVISRAQIQVRAREAHELRYSIKRLEPFYSFERSTPLREANLALTSMQAALELDDAQVAKTTKSSLVI